MAYMVQFKGGPADGVKQLLDSGINEERPEPEIVAAGATYRITHQVGKALNQTAGWVPIWEATFVER